MTGERERACPADAHAVARALASCDADGRKVTVTGGDTLCGMGMPSERTDLELLTTALSRIVSYEPADLTVAAQAGITLHNLGSALAPHGQFAPLDAPHPQQATLGGTLASGWLGPRRHLYGRPRDCVIGSTIALADGTIARAGGMVVKNVAGYDMSRLYVGSFGTLGVIVQANLKTLVTPARTRVFLAPLPEGTQARACAQLRSLPIRPSAAWWVHGFAQNVDGDDGQDGRLVVALEGSAVLVERATRDLRSALGRAGVPVTRVVDAGARETFQRTVDAYVSTLGERSVTYRLTALRERLHERTLALIALAGDFDVRCDALLNVMNADAIVRVSDLDARALGAKIEAIDDAVHEREPRAQIVASRHPHRPHLRVWGEPPAALERMRALKARFDPRRTLNPGRFVGGI